MQLMLNHIFKLFGQIFIGDDLVDFSFIVKLIIWKKVMRMLPLFATLFFVTYQCQAASRFPGNEFSQTLGTKGHLKAKGLDVSVDFPISWKIEEAKRPNTVALVTSGNGLGLETCALVINSLEQVGWTNDSAKMETSTTLADRERLEATAESMGGRLIDGGGANLEGLPSRWLLVAAIYSRDGSDTAYHSANWQVLFKHWFISLTCGVGAKSDKDAEGKLKSMLPTFRLIANSMLIPQRWK